ncbi:ABC transporter ATP-binding protein [Mesosutterella sp. OilRF-GAM-744-9]|uniref:ABC transporter ATP-binding protein n=1 Tax=Mesosutterella porci TaxID=2915351 RepID=A0ABS9MS76_9BURK|nr:ABC transporter ATP-binding protein [Mesosutterella sp. oilRF-744-WT-GAM-9]MCG5031483.1 ABC transporter ATP-binding protein [Mesosutterella sp. oilRF-744-WT-GAM-9]
MILEVRNGSFSYPGGRKVLDSISFSFDCRGIMSVLGRNGAGKTTMLRCMLGLQRWSSGGTYIDGVEASSLPPRRFWSRIGYVPQARSLPFVYTVGELALLGRSARIGDFSRPGPRDCEIARKALEAVGIAHLADKLCSRISGGEYQLALVARALAAHPEVLVLDEPESNLDFKNQLRVLRVLQRLSEERGIGSIINTHFPSHALEVSSQSLLMLPGRPPLFGPAPEVLTERNLSESFGVRVRIIPLDLPERPKYACVVPVA